MAKTHLSLSHDPPLLNRPTGFRLPSAAWCRAPARGSWSRSAATCSGCPGLGKTPAFMGVDIDEEGRTVGLF